jgi:hypothetical protein
MDGSRPAAFDAVFSDFKLVKTRSSAQLVLEIPIERADAVLAILGGVPQPGKEVSVAVARLMGNEAPVPPRDTEAQRVDRGPPSALCARCGHPKKEHSYHGARYGLCVGFVAADAPGASAPDPADALGDGVAGDTQAKRSPSTREAVEGAIASSKDKTATWDRSSRGRAGYIANDEGGRAVTRASLLCKDPAFQDWLRDKQRRGRNWGTLDREGVTIAGLRNELDINSRREIGTDPEALKRFLDLEFQFNQ